MCSLIHSSSNLSSCDQKELVMINTRVGWGQPEVTRWPCGLNTSFWGCSLPPVRQRIDSNVAQESLSACYLLLCWLVEHNRWPIVHYYFPARSDLFYWWLNAVAIPVMEHRTVNWSLFASLGSHSRFWHRPKSHKPYNPMVQLSHGWGQITINWFTWCGYIIMISILPFAISSRHWLSQNAWQHEMSQNEVCCLWMMARSWFCIDVSDDSMSHPEYEYPHKSIETLSQAAALTHMAHVYLSCTVGQMAVQTDETLVTVERAMGGPWFTSLHPTALTTVLLLVCHIALIFRRSLISQI